jgi:hypothetical protein
MCLNTAEDAILINSGLKNAAILAAMRDSPEVEAGRSPLPGLK